MDNLEIHYFPSTVPIPQDVLPEICALDYDLLRQEHKWMSEYTNGETNTDPQDRPDTPAEFDRQRKEHGWHTVIAIKRHPKHIELAGFMILNPQPFAEPYYDVRFKTGVWCVSTLITVPSMRGRGIGTSLLSYAMQLAKQFRIKNLTIDNTTKNTPANRLYMRMGFQPWAWYFIGKPIRESVSKNLLIPEPHNKLPKKTTDTLYDQYKKQLQTDAKYFYPINEIVNDVIEETKKLNLETNWNVYVFPNDHGWCSFGDLKDTRLTAYFPMCITSKGMQHPAQIRKYLHFLAEEGQKQRKCKICTLYAVQPKQRDLFLSAGLVEARISRIKSII